jgi:cytochrome c oxidase subunit 3
MAAPGVLSWASYLPFWNTVILLTSSVTVHFAHTAIKNQKRSSLIAWLAVTVLLGIIFLILQVEEYVHAYNELGLTLPSGIYGSTFFILTGFHGFHVTLGTLILLVQLLRAIRGHFRTGEDCFGFEAASWYWHFVDVVWVGLFIFVYVL